MYWRVHKGVAGDLLPQIQSWVAQQGDTLQVVDGAKRDLPAPVPQGYDAPGLALTTLPDARDLSWVAIPGVYWDRRKYEVSYYLPRLAAEVPLLNRGGLFLPVGCLSEITGYPQLQEAGVFIRPDSGQKPFPGQSFAAELTSAPHRMGMALIGLVAAYKLPPELMCYLAPAKALEASEWRLWVVNRKVVAWTPYSWTEDLPWAPAPGSVLAAAEAMAANPWQPDIAYVVDVGISNGCAYVLELNAASTSGLYQVPVPALFSALRAACILEAAGELESVPA